MPRRAKLTNALTKGVLDPMLRERIDLAHYYAGVRIGTNLEWLPQGGFTRRAGSMLGRKKRWRRRIEPVPISAAWITAHNGGTSANLVDQDAGTVFTTSAIGASPFVVAEVDLQAPVAVTFVDVVGFSCATSRADDALALEYWDGLAWIGTPGAEDTSLPPRFNIRTTPRTRRFASRPGEAIVARQWRLVVYGGVGLGAISVKGLRFWQEQNRVSAGRRVFAFAKSAAEVYQLVVTDRNIDVVDRGTYLASIPLPAAGGEIAELNRWQSLDTLLMFHEDIATPRVTRQGAPDEWGIDVPPFSNVPELSSEVSFTGAEDEIQRLTLTGLEAGDELVLFLGDMFTAPVVYSGVPGDLPALVSAALEALPGVDDDGVAVSLASVSPIALRIHFHGAVNGSRRWPRVNALVLGSDTAEPATEIVQRGLKPDGLLFSEETGWPRCGRVHQARLFLGGMRSAPSTLAMSTAVPGGLFDFAIGAGEEEDPVLPDNAIVHTLDSDQVETIHEIFVGRHLQIYTDSGEWWTDNRSFDATQPVNIIRATGHGVDPNVPVSFVEDATVFLQPRDPEQLFPDDGQSLRDFSYSDVLQNYAAEALTLLAPHLMTDVVDLAARKARSPRGGSQIYMPRAAGELTLLTLNKAQEVIAMSPWSTDGAYRAVAADTRNDVWMLVEREASGRQDLFLERRAAGVLTDASIAYQGAPITVMTGLEAHEGKQVWALADGDVVGPFLVSAGTITLEDAAASIVAGRFFAPDVESLPMRERLNAEQPFRPPGRIFEMEISVVRSGPFKIRANGGPLIEPPLRHADGSPLPSEATGEEPELDELDAALMERLFTGNVRIDKLEGFTRDVVWGITQDVPAPLCVRAIRTEIAYRG